MIRPNEQYAYFTITGEFDPAEITARVGVIPTDSWKKGDLHPINRLERKFSRWSLYSRLERSCTIEDHIADVLNQLSKNAEGFRSVSLEFGAQLDVIGHFHTDYPGLVLGREQVAAIAEFALKVDFDFYYMYAHRREDTD
jgi:hypothetical protein